MSVEIEFGELPESTLLSRNARHLAIAEALRARPGEWARVERDGNAGLAHHIRNGKIKPYQPAGVFEATSRRTPAGVDVWARYVGEQP
jgi:hypothetical protein